jgi:hypothetical protein
MSNDIFHFLRIEENNISQYELGHIIGENFKEQIGDYIGNSSRIRSLREMDHKEPFLYPKLEEYAQKHFLNYMNEIEGIADGSGQNPKDIALLNFVYEYPRDCSTLVFKDRDKIILRHNEDGEETGIGNSYILIANPEDENPFLAFCYPGMIPGNAFSFNSYGIVMTGNAMPDPEVRVGVPRHLIDRHMLTAETIDDAIDKALFGKRASGYSYTLASSKEREVINLETTSRKYGITKIKQNISIQIITLTMDYAMNCRVFCRNPVDPAS